MRYEPSVNERAGSRATRAGTAGPWTVSAPRVGDSGEARSRESAELDIWEDEGGATLKRATRYPGKKVESKVDSKIDLTAEWHGRELSGWRR